MVQVPFRVIRETIPIDVPLDSRVGDGEEGDKPSVQQQPEGQLQSL